MILTTAAVAPVAAEERAPPGCRWQEAAGGMIMACKDADGYWRRTGDGEIVGYDPPRRPARPAAPPAPRPAVETPPPAVEQPAPPAAPAAPTVAEAPEAVTPPPEPPIDPTPPRSPLEALLHWLVQLWRNFQTWIASLF